MARANLTESRLDRLEELMAQCVQQNLMLGQRIDASSQRMEAANLALGQRIDATNQRIDATNQRIDATLQEIRNQGVEIHAQGVELLRLRQQSEAFQNYVLPMLEKLPEAVRSQIGFHSPKL
jgi:chromosome segregation ATPase